MQKGKETAARDSGGSSSGGGYVGTAADIYSEHAAKSQIGHADIPRDKKSRKEITLSFGKRNGGGISDAAAKTAAGAFGEKERTSVRISTAEELSEFFERDSRRYDRTY